MNVNYKHKVFKIFISIYIISLAYIIPHNFINQVNFQRYSNIFVAFIELCLNGYVDLDYISFSPLFSSYIQIDSSLPSMCQGLMSTYSYFPNMDILYLILHKITGLPPQTLMISSFGAIFLPIIYLAMLKAYIPENEISARSFYIFYTLLGIYGILDLMTTGGCAGFYVATPGMSLIFTAFICIKKFYNDNSHRAYYYGMICLLILSLAHYWHSALMLLLFFIISLWIVSGFFYLSTLKSTKSANIRQKEDMKIIYSRSTSLFIISIIISLTFMHLWQSPYMGEFFRTAGLFDFLSKALIKVSGGIPSPVPYAFNYKDLFFGKGNFISVFLTYIFATLILLIPIILSILQSKRRKIIKVELPLIFALSIILAQILNVFAYYKTGCLDFFYVPLLFPIFGMLLFTNIKKEYKKRKKILKKFMILSLTIMIGLCLISNILLHLTHEACKTAITKYEDTKANFEWLYYNMDRDKTVITDFNILGKYLQREIKISKPSIEYEFVTPDSYSVLVGDSDSLPSYLTKDYAVIDHATMSEGLPIYSGTYISRLFVPLLDEINNCSSQDKIYEDNYISIFVFKSMGSK